jgi:hypothetical protein
LDAGGVEVAEGEAACHTGGSGIRAGLAVGNRTGTVAVSIVELVKSVHAGETSGVRGTDGAVGGTDHTSS